MRGDCESCVFLKKRRELASSEVRILAARAHIVTLGVQIMQSSEVSKFTVRAVKDDHLAVGRRESSSSLFGGLTHAFICPGMRDETGCATYLLGPQRREKK